MNLVPLQISSRAKILLLQIDNNKRHVLNNFSHLLGVKLLLEHSVDHLVD
jgi:hypothetical protein